MLEKRQAIRYRVGEGTDIVIFRDGGNVVAPLVDLSLRGLMAAMPEAEMPRLSPGQPVSGQLRRSGDVTTWRGHVVHRSPARCGIGVGIAFDAGADGDIFAAIQAVLRQPEAGGLHLRRDEGGLALEVHGRLSFLTSRDALAYIRHDSIRSLDLTHCSSVDSAGLGMLSLARERRVAVVGAQGTVKSLLAIARVSAADEPPGAPGSSVH